MVRKLKTVHTPPYLLMDKYLPVLEVRVRKFKREGHNKKMGGGEEERWRNGGWMEGWRDGGIEGWRNGGWKEGWRDGGWRDGGWGWKGVRMEAWGWRTLLTLR
jgi:hypothetical protein